MSARILLVEDDASIATVITAALEEEGYSIDQCDTTAGRDELVATNSYDVLLTDVVLKDGDGIATLPQLVRDHPDLPIIILSAQNTLDTAVRASETGAFEYFPKPFDLDELVSATRQAAARKTSATASSAEQTDAMPLVGRSQAMQGVFRLIARVLANDLTVLVLGESGTGKELVAEAIHQLGHRKSGPFVAVNTAAIPADLIESELFGHEKGAFTGAVSRSIGKFELASGGTLFLDEIGDMPMEAQTRLLRTLQSGKIRRVGGTSEIAVDVRIVAATNKDLLPMIAEGRFREDLFYRLNVVPILLPPLRERREDIPALARHFLALAAGEGLPARRFSDAAIAKLSAGAWRGNVRELKNVVYRLAVMARDETIASEAVDEALTRDDSAGSVGQPEGGADMRQAVTSWLRQAEPAPGAIYHSALAEFERPLFEAILQETGGNQLQAARRLGINRNTLRKRLTDLGIEPERI